MLKYDRVRQIIVSKIIQYIKETTQNCRNVRFPHSKEALHFRPNSTWICQMIQADEQTSFKRDSIAIVHNYRFIIAIKFSGQASPQQCYNCL